MTYGGLIARLEAFARDCVLHGDMTPTAERQLHHILNDTTDSSARTQTDVGGGR